MFHQPEIMLESSHRWDRLAELYLHSSASILAITGTAKLLSVLGSSIILDQEDPLFGIRFRWVLLLVSVLEFALASVCFCHRFSKRQRLVMIAVLASNFLFYRMMFSLSGWKRTCGCLGDLTEILQIPTKLADNILKFLLAYLLMGSTILLIVLQNISRGKN